MDKSQSQSNAGHWPGWARSALRLVLIAAVAAVVWTPSAGLAAKDKYYKYTDDDGQTHVVPDMDLVPDKYLGRVKDAGDKIVDERGNVVKIRKRRRTKGWADQVFDPMEWKPVQRRADRPAWIVFIAMWKSKLAFGLMVVMLILAMLAHGQWSARDLYRRDRIVYSILQPLAAVLALSLLWIALLGPETERFALECAERANEAAKQTMSGTQKHKKLTSLS